MHCRSNVEERQRGHLTVDQPAKFNVRCVHKKTRLAGSRAKSWEERQNEHCNRVTRKKRSWVVHREDLWCDSNTRRLSFPCNTGRVRYGLRRATQLNVRFKGMTAASAMSLSPYRYWERTCPFALQMSASDPKRH